MLFKVWIFIVKIPQYLAIKTAATRTINNYPENKLKLAVH